MKIALLCAYDHSYDELGKLTWDNNKALYAQRHGYLANKKIWSKRGIPPGWEKMVHLKEFLMSSEVDWAWVTGCDSMITNFNIDVRSLIDNQYHFMITADINGINADSFFLRNSKEGHQYLDVLLAKAQDSKYMLQPWQGGCGYFEQGAMTDTYEQWKSIIKVFPQRAFNSYDYSYLGTPPPQIDVTGNAGNWMQGDLLIHFPAMTLQRRIVYVKHYNNCIVGVNNPLLD